MTDTRDELVQRVVSALGPASDGAQLAQNTALAQRLVAALIELKLIRAAEQDATASQQEEADAALLPKNDPAKARNQRHR